MQRRLGAWTGAIVAVAALAPGLSAVRAIVDDWTPVGDDAAIAIRAHDVFTADTPVVGLPTTLGGEAYQGRVHHLGPMLFWALAVPERVAGSAPWGLVAGTAVVAVAALVAAGWAAARAAGTGAGVWALAVTAVMCWSLGRQLLVDPWNPYIAVLPVAASLFLAWAAAGGDAWALPALAATASFAAQAHLLYAPLALVLFSGAAVAVVMSRPAVRELASTAAVVGFVWSFPMWHELTDRPGNVVELTRALRADDQAAVSWPYALRAVGRSVGAIPLFARPAREMGTFGSELPAATAVTAVAVVVALVVLTGLALRRRDRIAVAAGGVALVGLATVTVTTAQVPVAFPDVAFYRMLALWPIGAFAWFALGFSVVRSLRPARTASRVAVAAGAALLAAAAPGAAFVDSAEPEDPRLMAAVRSLARDAEPHVDDLGAVRVDVSGELGEGVRYGIVRELRRRGIDARVDAGDPYLAADDVAPPGAPTLLVVSTGMREALAEGARRVAEYGSSPGDDVERIMRLEREVRALLAARGGATAAGIDPYVAYRDGTFLRLAAAGELSLGERDVDLLREYYEARFAVEELTFAAYLVPGD